MKFQNSTTLPMFGFLRPSSVSASSSPVSLDIFNFLLNICSVGKSYPHSPDKISFDVPVIRRPDSKLMLDTGMSNFPS